MPLARSITLRSPSALLSVEFVLQAREGVKARDAQIEDRLDAILLQIADDVGDTRVDRRLDRGGVALVDEHRDRRFTARLIWNICSSSCGWDFQIDQDNVGSIA